MPSTSFTIFNTVSIDATPTEEAAPAESDEGATADPSSVAGLVARFVPVSSADVGEGKMEGGRMG